MKKNVLVFVLTVAVLVLLSACGGQGSSGNGTSQNSDEPQSSVSAEPQILSPTETVDKFMQATKEQDEGVLQQVYAGDPDELIFALNYEELNDALDDETLLLFDEKAHSFDYTIGNVKEKGDTATAEVTIKTCDFGSLLKEFLEEYEIKALQTALKGEDDGPVVDAALKNFETGLAEIKPDSERTTTLTLTRTDRIWKVDSVKNNAEFMDALSGGSYSVFIDINKEMKALMKEAEEEDDGEI